MCCNAVEVAAFGGQDLVVVVITDFDPKRMDMLKSVARKIEVEAALVGIGTCSSYRSHEESAEVNAFEARAPEAYYEAIVECVRLYYDEMLSDRIYEAQREVRVKLADRLDKEG